MSLQVFIAYPSTPPQLKENVERAVEELESARSSLSVQSWEQIDIPGRFIADGILEEIEQSDVVVADITRLNFNVTFEIGYALGKSKRVVLCVNEALSPQTKELTQLGMYDTLGYRTYQNSTELKDIIKNIRDTNPARFPVADIDSRAPVFVQDTLHKTNASVRITSKIKKAGYRYRSFDPEEQPRLSGIAAFRGVSKSIAIVVHLLSSNATDHVFNNMRGAFLAGLSYGLEKDVVILQDGTDVVPVDLRELVEVYRRADDIDVHINDMAPRIAEGLQSYEGRTVATTKGFLANIDLGDPAAENEIETLGDYYVATDQFSQVLNGTARLAVGRKGSGKSALFFQVRDNLRRRRTNVVLDLKPEGHQLTRFKSLVLRYLKRDVQEHVVTAFWEYVLLLEICIKIIEADWKFHVRNSKLTGPYQRLRDLYTSELLAEEGDFSERMLRLVERISSKFLAKYGDSGHIYLDHTQVTELVYSHDIRQLRQHLANYLQHKDGVYILFDNLDKGWPTRGVDEVDIVMLRALMEASRKLERHFSSRDIAFSATVFIRNDVHE